MTTDTVQYVNPQTDRRPAFGRERIVALSGPTLLLIFLAVAAGVFAGGYALLYAVGLMGLQAPHA